MNLFSKRNKYIGENTLPKSERPKPLNINKGSCTRVCETTILIKPPKTDSGVIPINTNNERMSVLVQALRLTLRHIDGKSGLDKEEFKNYIETVLKVY